MEMHLCKNALTQSRPQKLAVLIDGDNAQAAAIESILAEAAKLGIVTAKRIYADWTLPNHVQWKKSLLANAIQPIQQFAFANGKNCTDSALIIDAMDLLYSRRFDGFCLVSSDSDFTKLAQRIREEGVAVFGFGEKKTPDSLVASCNKFFFTEDFKNQKETARFAKANSVLRLHSPMEYQRPKEVICPVINQDESEERLADPPMMMLREAIKLASSKSQWVPVSTVLYNIKYLIPGFKASLFGYKNLGILFDAYPNFFILEYRMVPGKINKVLFVKLLTESTQ